MKQQVQDWLTRFGLDAFLHGHVAEVVLTLPDPVRRDLVEDPGFHLCDYEPGPGVVAHVPVGAPRRNGAGRSVALKRTLRHRPPAFVRYVIAHEFAHAHL